LAYCPSIWQIARVLVVLSKTTRIAATFQRPEELGDLAQRVADAAALDRPAAGVADGQIGIGTCRSIPIKRRSSVTAAHVVESLMLSSKKLPETRP